MPAISVIIPVFNRAQLVERAVQSALAQTFQDIEIIVVDDGSTEDLLSASPALHHPRVHYIRQTNQGPAAARNTGVATACGEYVSFLDSDDALLPCNLELLHGRLASAPQAGIAHGWAVVVDQDGAEAQRTRPVLSGRPFLNYLYQNPTPIGTLLIRRECLATRELFDERLPLFEDWELWLRLSFHCTFIAVPARVARIHLQGVQRSKGRPAVEVGVAARAAYRKLLDDPIARPHVTSRWRSLMANAHVMVGHHYRVFEQDIPSARREFVAALRLAPGLVRAYLGLVETLPGTTAMRTLRAWRSHLFAVPGRRDTLS